MDYTTRKDFQFRATKQHVRRQISDSIRADLANMQQAKSDHLADFISPAIRNLGLLGAGLGATKGALEPGLDDAGQPMSMSGRLGNILTNSVMGGVAGAGAGVGYKALNPGANSIASRVGGAISDIPDAIAGKQGLLDKITDTANADELDVRPSKIGETSRAVQGRIRRDKSRTKQFFTGKGQGVVEEARPVGKTITTIDPTTQEATEQFIPTKNKFGDDVTENVTSVTNNAQIDQTPGVKRAAQIAGATIGGGLGSALGPLGTLGGVGGGVALGSKVGDAVVETADAINSKGLLGGIAAKASTDLERTKQALDYVGDVPKQAVTGAISGIGNAYSGVTQNPTVQKVGNTFRGQLRDIRQNLGFEQSSKHIVHFGSQPINGYQIGAGAGLGLGIGAGAISQIADTMNRQGVREQQEIQDINAIDNPYMRVGAYQDYTSEDNTNLRSLRDSGDVLARGALGAGVGAGVGLGVGGFAGSLLDNAQKKRGLLSKLRG
jgi:hypothetical protein